MKVLVMTIRLWWLSVWVVQVSILNHEKMAVEEQTEALLEEISEFEEAVNTLEKEVRARAPTTHMRTLDIHFSGPVTPGSGSS
jgi:hypothetical protein